MTRKPRIVGDDTSIFPEGIPVAADELPRERDSKMYGRAVADAVIAATSTQQGGEGRTGRRS